jgi:hypothetical protein
LSNVFTGVTVIGASRRDGYIESRRCRALVECNATVRIVGTRFTIRRATRIATGCTTGSITGTGSRGVVTFSRTTTGKGTVAAGFARGLGATVVVGFRAVGTYMI